MRLTTYTDYTLRVLMYLGLHPGRIVTVGEIAAAYGVSAAHLNKVVRHLALSGEIETLLAELQGKLIEWKDASGTNVIQRARLKHETYNGAYTRLGPDLVIGYAPGCRASSETGLGKIPQALTEPNHDHWGADHCIEADAVPGVIFANRDLQNFGGISFRDVPFLVIGKHLDQSHIKPPSQVGGGQGQKDLEERLKGLGYL